MIEKAVLFGKTGSNLGITTQPSTSDTKEIGIIILNAGSLHRVGPNRMSVEMARKLSELGYLVFRFDFSGIGDSIANGEKGTFNELAIEETRESIKYLNANNHIDQFIVIGICSGADIAFLACVNEPRIIGAVLINAYFLDISNSPLRRKEASINIKKRYYFKQLSNGEKWTRVFKGRSDSKAILLVLLGLIFYLPYLLAKSVIRALKLDRNKLLRNYFETINKRGANLFLIYSEGSTTYDVYDLNVSHQLKKSYFSSTLTFLLYKNTDHVFTPIESQNLLFNDIAHWLNKVANKP